MNNFVKFDPCPFCDSNMIHFERVDLGNIVSKYHWRVHCRKCNASTGLYENQADAYKMWQRTESNIRYALEKQIPKKPILDALGYFHCPSCGGDEYCLMHDGIYADRFKYCNECGQRLNWKGVNRIK